jgi:uncharacterized damage-inducible protein DinB
MRKTVMKILNLTMRSILAFCLCLGCGSVLASDEGKMTAEERAKAIKLLVDSHKETLEAVEKLSEAQLKFKTAPERWSVGEVAEHIMLAEGTLFSRLESAMAAKPNPAWQEQTKGKTEFLEKVLVNRQGKAQAPEAIVPTGKLSKTELIARLKEARAKTMKFAETTQEPIKAHTAEHPFPIFKTLNAYQWLIYIPLHNLRHNQQIAEVMASPNFPKN